LQRSDAGRDGSTRSRLELPCRLRASDAVRTAGELWNDEVAEPVAGGWPVLEIDTNQPVDVTAVVAEIRRLHSAR